MRMENEMTWHTIRYDRIEALKASWPCHGLPDDLGSLSVETASNGDVVDIEAYVHHTDGRDEQLDWREFDGLAFKALVDECVEFGDVSDPDPVDSHATPKPSSPAL
jgi:hypothetical protein